VTLAAHQDPRLVARAGEVLAGLATLCPSLETAMLLTDDGFTVAQVPEVDDGDDRMASMASSVQALGDAVGRELGLGDGDYVVIAGESGLVVQRRIRGLPVVLAAHFGTGEQVDAALQVTRSAAEWLAHEYNAIVSGDEAPPRRRGRHAA